MILVSKPETGRYNVRSVKLQMHKNNEIYMMAATGDQGQAFLICSVAKSLHALVLLAPKTYTGCISACALHGLLDMYFITNESVSNILSTPLLIVITVHITFNF